LVTFVLLSAGVRAQTTPEVLKVEPPSWWAGSSVNPVRLLIRGNNLKNARVNAVGGGWRIVGAPKTNERGTYLFVDVAIAANAKPGTRSLIINSGGKPSSFALAEASFEILPPLRRAGRFQGFSPADVMYLIMLDRFSDGDSANNDPPQSRGIFDRENKFYYHGGDLQGVIDRLPYLKDLGVTAVWLTPWYDNYDHPNQIELKEGKPSTGFHGYNPQDFYGVEEHFGTLAKLQELVAAAHRSGIKIIQDEVVNRQLDAFFLEPRVQLLAKREQGFGVDFDIEVDIRNLGRRFEHAPRDDAADRGDRNNAFLLNRTRTN